MNPFIQLILDLVIILLAAKVAGYLSTRIGQPSVLGELAVGILLGPSLLNITHLPFVTDPHLGETIYQLGEMGVLLLMFLAGLELHLAELLQGTRVAVLSGSFGVLVPSFFGFLFGLFSGMPVDQAFFLGLTLGATSVSISAQTLFELKMLRSPVGLALMGAAVIDDILVLLLLSAFLALTSGAGTALSVLWVFIKMLLFLAAAVLFGLWVLPRITRFISRLSISQGVVTLAIISALCFSIAAEYLGGMAGITGAFIAGLMFARTPEKKLIDDSMRALAYSFFVPIFFVNIGLSINIRDLPIAALGSLLVLTALAILGKTIGAGLGGLAGGFSKQQSLQLGVGMISRGEVGLITAAVGLKENLISTQTFSAIVGMVLITTLVTPPLLRMVFTHKQSKSLSFTPTK
jgi:Kef-type K+ transport system membrane component KefB